MLLKFFIAVVSNYGIMTQYI